MTVRAIDPVTGDIITSGKQFITSREEIAQTIRTRLKLFLGEYFRDITQGTPWFQEILGKQGTLANKERLIKRQVIQTEGVVSLLTFNTDFDVNSRTYTVSGQALTEFGAVEFGVSI